MSFGASGIDSNTQSEKTEDKQELTEEQRKEFKDNIKDLQKEYNVIADHIDTALAQYSPVQDSSISGETGGSEKKPSSKLERMQVTRSRKKFDTAEQAGKQKETQEKQSLGSAGRDSQIAAKEGPLASGI